MADDEAVQETNDDATACKRCAVELGYWKDDVVSLFVRSAERRAPEINRGYYARVQGCYAVVQRFLEQAGGEGQIVSLGAGFDTLYWRLQADNSPFHCIYEIDFKAVVARKALAVKNKRKLNEALVEAKITGSGISSRKYHLISSDIRDPTDLNQRLLQAGVDVERPTLFLCECVLVYLAPEESEGLLKWAAESFPTSIFLNYEPVNLSDRFGQVMLANLKSRGCTLRGGLACETLADQKTRFLNAGWKSSDSLMMNDVYRMLPSDDMRRMEKLEFLDETELLHQLLDHYCFSWAVNDARQLGLASVGFT